MFGFGRRRSHGQLAKAELGESVNHLRQAATHAAGGMGAAVGPRVQTARRQVAPAATRVRSTATGGWESAMTAVAPLAVAAATGARQAGSAARAGQPKKVEAVAKKMKAHNKKKSAKSSRRWPSLAGLLVAGAVTGAVGAAVLRRRRQAEWDSYDPAPALDEVSAEAVPATALSSANLSAGGTDPLGPVAEPLTTPITESVKQSAAKSGGKGTDAGLGVTVAPTPNGRA